MTERSLSSIQPPPNPAEPGNGRAIKSGATSRQALAPLATPIAADLHRRYPDVTGEECMSQAIRLAAVQLAAEWIADHGIVKPGKSGQTFDIGRRMVGWTTSIDRWFAERRAEAQAKRTEHGAAMRDVLARLEGGRETPPDADVLDDEDAEVDRDDG